MNRKSLASIGLLLAIAGCGGPEDAGGLTADERQRLENIAARLDEENAEVRELLETNALHPVAPANDENGVH